MGGGGHGADTRAMLRRRAAAATAAATAQQPGHRGLATCVLCAQDAVAPVAWEPAGEDRWWMALRCGACGIAIEVVVPDAVAERYDRELARDTMAIRRAADDLERERMGAEVDAFVGALHDGLVAPADFGHAGTP
jgi:hypothetical protein